MSTASAPSFTGPMAAVTKTGAAAGLRSRLRAALEWFAYQRALATLSQLDKSELAALGISRFALPSIARDLVRRA